MSTNIQAAFAKAINEFRKWCHDNPELFNDVFVVGMRSMHQSNVQSSDAEDGDAKPKTDSTINSQQYDKLAEIAAGIEHGLHPMRELGKNVELLDMNKGFGDLIKEGPSNAAEYHLMQAAEAHLEPHERDQAIRDNTKVSNVVKSINQSIINAQVMIAQELHKEKAAEKKEEVEQTREKQVDKRMMRSLGDEYGILDEVVKSIRERDQQQNLNLSWMKGGEKVNDISASVADNFKNMPNGKSQEQAKGWTLGK